MLLPCHRSMSMFFPWWYWWGSHLGVMGFGIAGACHGVLKHSGLSPEFQILTKQREGMMFRQEVKRSWTERIYIYTYTVRLHYWYLLMFVCISSVCLDVLLL